MYTIYIYLVMGVEGELKEKYVRIILFTSLKIEEPFEKAGMCLYNYIYIFIYIYMYVYICIYMYTHIYHDFYLICLSLYVIFIIIITYIINRD